MKKPAISELTLREKIGQMLVLSCGTLCKVDDVKEFLDNNPYGSLWAASYMKMSFLNEFNENNMPGYENKVDYMNVAAEVDDSNGLDYTLDLKYRAFKEKYTGHYKVPLLYCLDAESGLRSTFHYYTSTPSATAIGATNDPEYAYKYGKAIGHELKTAGVGWVWSPVADRPSPFASSSIGRTYSSNRELAQTWLLTVLKVFSLKRLLRV